MQRARSCSPPSVQCPTPHHAPQTGATATTSTAPCTPAPTGAPQADSAAAAGARPAARSARKATPTGSAGARFTILVHLQQTPLVQNAVQRARRRLRATCGSHLSFQLGASTGWRRTERAPGVIRGDTRATRIGTAAFASWMAVAGGAQAGCGPQATAPLRVTRGGRRRPTRRAARRRCTR